MRHDLGPCVPHARGYTMNGMDAVPGSFRTIVITITAFFLVTGLSAIDRAPTAWTFVTGGRVIGSPVVTGSGRVYAVAEDRFLYAIENGVARWRYDLRVRPLGPIRVSPDGTVVVRTTADALIAVNPRGGTVWAYRHRTEVTDFGYGADGQILLGDADGIVTGLSTTGRAVFRVTIGESPVSAIVRGSGYYVYAATRDGRVAAITDGGARIFRRSFEARIVSIASTPDRVFVALSDGRLVAVDEFGREAWTIRVPETPRGLGVVGAHIVLITADSVRFLDDTGTTTGSEHFEGIGDAVITRDGAFVTSGSEVYFVRASGPRAPAARFASRVRSIGAGGGRVAVGTDDWVLSSFGDVHATTQSRTGSRIPYWRTSYDHLFLKDQLSAGPEQALRATREMSSRVESADLAGSYHSVRELLMDVAARRTTGTTRSIPPDVRSAAVRALGRAGDFVVRDFLVRSAAVETEPLVVEAIFDALTDTGITNAETVLRVAARHLSLAGGTTPSSGIARAAVDLVIAAHRYEGYLPEAGVDVLRRATEAPFPRDVREYALTAARQIDGR